MNNKPQTWTVVYRLGGTANFRWQTSCAFASQDDARACRDAVIAGGRLAYVYKTAHVQTIGLPESYA